ncbi:MAG: T9SS type A sorting domain-containing protein [Bacteroidales bacterium]|nr:T9SS type A sorting domain-containing protein [Bacteroidales bacterium]
MGISSLSISDPSGRVVFSMDDFKSGVSKLDLNPGLKPGLYIITVSGTNFNYSHKLLIER